MSGPAAPRAASSAFAEIDWRGRPVRIEYRRLGRPDATTPPIVFLHEGLGSLAMWKEFPERFCADHGWRGLAFSRPGYGRSTPKPPDEHWATDFQHRQAHEVLPALFAALGIERPWLFGHSDGGSIALLYAARFETAGVIAVAPHVFVEDVAIASIRNARVAYRSGDLRSRLARYHDDADSAFHGWNDAWLAPAFRAWTIEAEIEAIRCPVLAVQGTDDEYGTLAQLDRLKKRVPGAELLELADCGHAPHLQRREALVDNAARFIRQHSGPVPAGDLHAP